MQIDLWEILAFGSTTMCGNESVEERKYMFSTPSLMWDEIRRKPFVSPYKDTNDLAFKLWITTLLSLCMTTWLSLCMAP